MSLEPTFPSKKKSYGGRGGRTFPSNNSYGRSESNPKPRGFREFSPSELYISDQEVYDLVADLSVPEINTVGQEREVYPCQLRVQKSEKKLAKIAKKKKLAKISKIEKKKLAKIAKADKEKSANQLNQGDQPVWVDADDNGGEIDVTNFTIDSKLKRTEDDRVVADSKLKRTKDGRVVTNSKLKGTEDGCFITGDQYRKRLREKFAANSKPSWALTAEELLTDQGDDAMSALYDLTRSTGKITTTSKYLPKTYISTSKQRDITVGANGNGPLTHVKFHPTRTVLMTAGQKDNKVCFFEVCNSRQDITIRKGNNFLQDVCLPGYEIASCDFYNDGQSVFIGSVKKPFFYTYDLIDGKISEIPRPFALPKYNYGKFTISDDGKLIAFIGASSQVYVYELKTMVAVHTFSASAKLADVKFAPGDHTTLYGYSIDGSVFIWDLYAPEYQRSFHDEGCVGPTCLAVSRNGQFIACGTGTAIVNVYSRATVEQMVDENKTIKPVYTIDNLTTKVNNLKFNHDAQLLAFLSPIKRMAYRLSHVASGTTFQNFPPKQEMLHKEIPTCVDFSPHSAFVAFGTMSGLVRLYRLNGFSEY